MRVLFILGYPGYLRYYDSTIQLLAQRGHEVVCVFEQPSKQEEGLRALEGASARITVKRGFPRHSIVWERLPRETRRIADWVRYLDPRFEEAHYLRERAANLMVPPLRRLRHVRSVSPTVSSRLMQTMMAIERHLPAYEQVKTFLLAHAPDVVVVTPLVTSASRQPDIVKAAQALGIPSVLGVASWDHLTSKGLIRVFPDRVLVWNEVQRREAIELHEVPAERVLVTGAQPWDRWFERQPSVASQEFKERVGLPRDKPFILFVGSTASISAPQAELEFVREWVSALRRSRAPELRDMGVLVRPHPFNPGLWAEADLSDLGSVSVFPRGGANPVDEGDRSAYFDSMYYSSAVVGINTSAMIESAIVGRPVLTIRSPRFADSQSGTVHFSYMLPEHGGFVRVAETIEQHERQLSAVLAEPETVSTEIERFVRGFVRPHGIARPATPFVVDGIEDVMFGGRREAERMPLRRKPGMAALWTVGAVGVLADRRHLGRVMAEYAGPAFGHVRRAGDVMEAGGQRAATMLRASAPSSVRRPALVLAEGVERLTGSAARSTQLGADRAGRFLKSRGAIIFAREQARAKARKARAKAEKERRRAEGPGHPARQARPVVASRGTGGEWTR